jgi:hypothetical protein
LPCILVQDAIFCDDGEELDGGWAELQRAQKKSKAPRIRPEKGASAEWEETSRCPIRRPVLAVGWMWSPCCGAHGRGGPLRWTGVQRTDDMHASARDQIKVQLLECGWSTQFVERALAEVCPVAPLQILVDQSYLDNLKTIKAAVEREGGKVSRDWVLLDGKPLVEGMEVDGRAIQLLNFPTDEDSMAGAGDGVVWEPMEAKTGAVQFEGVSKLCCTLAMFQSLTAEGTGVRSRFENVVLSDLHPMVRPAAEAGAAASSTSSNRIVRASIKAHVEGERAPFVPHRLGGGADGRG